MQVKSLMEDWVSENRAQFPGWGEGEGEGGSTPVLPLSPDARGGHRVWLGD